MANQAWFTSMCKFFAGHHSWRRETWLILKPIYLLLNNRELPELENE
jgi:hypothetical protein